MLSLTLILGQIRTTNFFSTITAIMALLAGFALTFSNTVRFIGSGDIELIGNVDNI
jgi:hypothetical protein